MFHSFHPPHFWILNFAMETVEEKSRRFAARIVRMADYLRQEKKEYVVSTQVLNSGTSVGANIAEAESTPSKRDFHATMYIAFKECNETIFWLETLHKAGKLNDKEFQSIYKDCCGIRNMLAAITKTTRENIEKEKSGNK